MRILVRLNLLFLALLVALSSYAIAAPRKVVLSDGREVTITEWGFKFSDYDKDLCKGDFDLIVPTKEGELIDYYIRIHGHRNEGDFISSFIDTQPSRPEDWAKLKGQMGPKNCKKVLEDGVLPIMVQDGILAEDGVFRIMPKQLRLESESLNDGPTRQKYNSKFSHDFHCSPEALASFGGPDVPSGGEVSPSKGYWIDDATDLLMDEFAHLPPGVGGGDAPIPRIPSALPCDDLPKIKPSEPAPGETPRWRGPPPKKPTSPWWKIFKFFD